MTLEKIREVLQRYEKLLKEQWSCDDTRFNSMLGGAFEDEQLNHIYWMCKEVQAFLNEDTKEKAMRWLGFIQGVLWTQDIYKINDLKEHNKP